jgi:hypothetical protein
MPKRKKKAKRRKPSKLPAPEPTLEAIETPTQGEPISREVIRHPDGSVEEIVKYEPPPDWREVVADLERLERQLRRRG